MYLLSTHLLPQVLHGDAIVDVLKLGNLLQSPGEGGREADPPRPGVPGTDGAGAGGGDGPIVLFLRWGVVTFRIHPRIDLFTQVLLEIDTSSQICILDPQKGQISAISGCLRIFLINFL